MAVLSFSRVNTNLRMTRSATTIVTSVSPTLRYLSGDASAISRSVDVRIATNTPVELCRKAAGYEPVNLILVTRNVDDVAPTGVQLFNPWG